MQSVRPHWAWFLLAPAFAIVGIVVAVAIVVVGVAGIAAERQIISVPGSGYVNIDQPGCILISFEETGAAPARTPPGLRVTLTAEGDDQPLPLSTPNSTYTYHFAGVAGRSFASAEVPAVGRYRLVAELPSDTIAPPDAAIAVGRGPGGAMLGLVFGAFAAAGTGALLAILVLAILGVKRSNFRKSQMARFSPGPLNGPGR